uniref:Uncharacterized protein n=1 Tax=Oryza punctata TaxID=4537 RepID=A0A0E0MEM6_ORYPU
MAVRGPRDPHTGEDMMDWRWRVTHCSTGLARHFLPTARSPATTVSGTTSSSLRGRFPKVKRVQANIHEYPKPVPPSELQYKTVAQLRDVCPFAQKRRRRRASRRYSKATAPSPATALCSHLAGGLTVRFSAPRARPRVTTGDACMQLASRAKACMCARPVAARTTTSSGNSRQGQ